MMFVRKIIPLVVFNLLITSTGLLFCCQGKRCMEDVTFCPLPATGERYFSGYKEGSYRIYHNKDSTKRDSVYITDYSLLHRRDERVDCHEWDGQEMNINSKYLADAPMPCTYQNPECEESYFYVKSSKFVVFIYAHTQIDTLYGLLDNGSTITQFSSFTDPIRNEIYKDAIKYEVDYFHQKFWFSPEKGLIQFTAFDDQDTMYLTKFHKA